MTASMAASLLEFLGDRYRPRAVAWRTVHIVWNLDAAVISRENLENLLFLASEANFKLVLFAPDPAASALKPLVEEVGFGLTSLPRLP